MTSHHVLRKARSASTVRTAVLVVCCVLLLWLPGASAAYRNVFETEDAVASRSVALIAPAVGERADGTLVGVGMTMQVTVRDGSGGVYVDTRPLTQMDMQGSARIAAATASAIAGADMSQYDFFVTTRAGSPVVGGPSAGAAMTVAFASLLLDVPLRDDVVMTGMVNPDGSVGPVGGILEKAGAAQDAGATRFLIPPGQSVVQRVVRETDESGWFPTVRQRVEEVDVAAYAQAEWGMEVMEVADVYDAFRLTTDHVIERPAPAAEADSEAFLDVMGAASRTQHADAVAEAASLRQRLQESGLADADPGAHADLTTLLDRAQAKLDTALAAIDNGSPYAASSWVFQANIDQRKVDYWLDGVAAGSATDTIAAEGERVAEAIDDVATQAAAARPGSVSTLEAVGAAQVRVLEARRLLAAAQTAHNEGRISDAVDALAFAEERRRSVTWWLGLVEALDARGGPALEAEPARLAEEYAMAAQQAVTYAGVILGQTGSSQVQSRLLGEANANLRDATSAKGAGLQVGALYLAMEAQVAAHAALSLVGSEALLDDRIDRQRERALLAVAETRRLGAEPFLAVSFLDFADELRVDQPVDALLMFGNAATIAAASTALASGRDCGLAGVLCDAAPPVVSRVAMGPGLPDPWTGYFALATVVLGFMAGILVTLVVASARARREALHQAPAPPAPLASARPLPSRLATGPAPRRPSWARTDEGLGARTGVLVPPRRPANPK